MADVVQRYAAMGHTWMKFHLCQFENVIDQVKAIDAVAPEGFKIHFGERPLVGSALLPSVQAGPAADSTTLGFCRFHDVRRGRRGPHTVAAGAAVGV